MTATARRIGEIVAVRPYDRRMRRVAWIAVVIAAVEAAASSGALGGATAGAQDAPPACGRRTRSPPMLTRYDELTRGARFLVRLHYDEASRAWTPSPQLAMPLHHASTLEYVGYRLPRAHDFDLELEVTAVSRRLVEYDARINTWFFAYRVRVRSACSIR